MHSNYSITIRLTEQQAQDFMASGNLSLDLKSNYPANIKKASSRILAGALTASEVAEVWNMHNKGFGFTAIARALDSKVSRDTVRRLVKTIQKEMV